MILNFFFTLTEKKTVNKTKHHATLDLDENKTINAIL